MYDDSICCNTATLSLSHGNTEWVFYINQLYTGFQALSECEGENLCESEVTEMTVGSYQVVRVLTRQTSTAEILEGYLATLQSDGTRSRGFGAIGFNTEYISADNTKYFISYQGDSIEENLETLDKITKSLRFE